MVKVRDGEMKYTPQMSDYFFEALDAIDVIEDFAAGRRLPLDVVHADASLYAPEQKS